MFQIEGDYGVIIECVMKQTKLPWLEKAKEYIGTAEKVGKAENPVIVKMWEQTFIATGQSGTNVFGGGVSLCANMPIDGDNSIVVPSLKMADNFYINN